MTHWLGRLTRRRYTPLVVGLVTFFLHAILTVTFGIPEPQFHDEFAYLLASDTYAQGRLTNPPHPMAVHFETFFVLQHPTYQAKYQPAQGLVLALGQVLAKQPIVGAWLSMALAAAAICWALRPWLGPRWSPAAAIAFCLQGQLLYWGQCFWGGGLPLLGGALVFGGAIRLTGKYPRWPHVATIVLGATVLFNTRPYEGFILCLLLITPLVFGPIARDWRAYILALPLILLSASWTAYYNYRVTGHPTRLPYLESESQHSLAPRFLFLPPLPPSPFAHERLRTFAEQELLRVQYQETLPGFLFATREKLTRLAADLALYAVLPLGLLGLPWAFRRRRVRLAIGVLLLFLAALLLDPWIFPHYAAPALPVLAFLEIAGLRALALRLHIARPAPLLVVLAACALGLYGMWAYFAPRAAAWGSPHRQLVDSLLASPGDDLVICRYLPDAPVTSDWVYNRADIDAQPIVWARDMGDEKNRELLSYYAGRRTVWLLTISAQGHAIEPYNPS